MMFSRWSRIVAGIGAIVGLGGWFLDSYGRIETALSLWEKVLKMLTNATPLGIALFTIGILCLLVVTSDLWLSALSKTTSKIPTALPFESDMHPKEVVAYLATDAKWAEKFDNRKGWYEATDLALRDELLDGRRLQAKGRVAGKWDDGTFRHPSDFIRREFWQQGKLNWMRLVNVDYDGDIDAHDSGFGDQPERSFDDIMFCRRQVQDIWPKRSWLRRWLMPIPFEPFEKPIYGEDSNAQPLVQGSGNGNAYGKQATDGGHKGQPTPSVKPESSAADLSVAKWMVQDEPSAQVIIARILNKGDAAQVSAKYAIESDGITEPPPATRQYTACWRNEAGRTATINNEDHEDVIVGKIMKQQRRIEVPFRSDKGSGTHVIDAKDAGDEKVSLTYDITLRITSDPPNIGGVIEECYPFEIRWDGSDDSMPNIFLPTVGRG